MEETFKTIGRLRLELETANRQRMWDWAKEACEAMARQYKLLELQVKQKEDEK